MSMLSNKFAFTPWNATKFFTPLCIQAISQSLTYPLVGAIVAHGPGGTLEYGAFIQGLIVMFLFGCLGSGLVTTGMVFAKDKVGYYRYIKVNNLVMVIVATLQVLCFLRPVADVVFGRILDLGGMQFEVARYSMLGSILAQMGFFQRNVSQVILYNAHKTSLANLATILRIVITVGLSPIFFRLGMTGWAWGCVALSLPVFFEMCLMRYLARKHIRNLPNSTAQSKEATCRRQFLFNIPLSLGGCLLTLSVFMLNAVVNRTSDGANMLTIHILAMGLINPASYGALRCQAVAIAFPKTHGRDHRTFLFSLCAGIVISLVLLMLQIPLIAKWYFGTVQNLSEEFIPLARHAVLLSTAVPILQALRAHAEGLAAYQKRPNAILAGQAVFLGAVLTSLTILYFLGTPGYIMGVRSLIVASFATFVTIRLGLLLATFEESPSVWTRTREDSHR